MKSRKPLHLCLLALGAILLGMVAQAQTRPTPANKPAPQASPSSQAQIDSYLDSDTLAAQYGSDQSTPQGAGFSDAWYDQQNRVLLNLIGKLSYNARQSEEVELQYEQRFQGDKREIFINRLNSTEMLMNGYLLHQADGRKP